MNDCTLFHANRQSQSESITERFDGVHHGTLPVPTDRSGNLSVRPRPQRIILVETNSSSCKILFSVRTIRKCFLLNIFENLWAAVSLPSIRFRAGTRRAFPLAG